MPATERFSAFLDLDAFVEPFESAMARGDAPDIVDFLPPSDHPKYSLILRELIRLDLEFAWDRGERPRLDSYVAQFPNLADEPAALAEIAREEWRQRVAAGEDPDPREYHRKYGLNLSTEFGSTPAANTAPMWTGNQMPVPGDMLPPGFIVRSELGRGAFGRVYLAEQADLAGRQVAIKVSSRLVGEAQTLARLQHTNIVPIYSVHRAGEFQILVMPYLGSATLADLLKSIRANGTMPATAKPILTAIASKGTSATSDPQSGEATVASTPALPETLALATMDYTRAVLGLAASLADGLAHAHSRGILHRDLKPANVLLAVDGRPMLLDFNLAADEAGSEGIVGGTPRYMAPEHLASLSGEPITLDGRADIYSLGLVLHELLTGQIPFPDRSGTWNEVVRENRKDRADSPTVKVGSPSVAAILNKCLEADRDRRYRSANELHEDLTRHLDNRVLRIASEPWSRERIQKWGRRHPRLTSATTVAGLAMIALIALGTLFYSARREINERHARDERDQLLQTRDDIQSMVLDSRGPASRLHDAQTRAKIALAPYDDAREHWRQTPAVRDLPADEHEELREALVHVLYYQAEAGAIQAEREQEKAKRMALIDEALQVNERARGMFAVQDQPQPVLDQRDRLLVAGGMAKPNASGDSGRYPGPVQFPEALTLLRERKYAEAAKRFEQLGVDGRRSFAVWMGLGTARLRMAQFEAAADAFLAAGVVKPDNPWAVFYRGVALLSAGKLPAAREMFDRFLADQPSEVDGWLNRAIVRFRLGDFPGTLDDAQAAERLDGSPTRIHSLRERVAKTQGNLKLAAEEHAQILVAKPRDAEDWTIRGESRLRHSPVEAKSALADFDAALAVDPDHAEALRGKASCLSEHLNRPKDAIETLDKLLSSQPDNVEDRGGYAVLLARSGRANDARVQARRCVTPGTSAMVLYQAASALALVANTPAERSETLELIRRVLRQDPAWASDMPRDPDLKSIQADPVFQEIVRAARTLQKRDGNAQ